MRSVVRMPNKPRWEVVRDCNGAAAIEMAIVFPLFLVVVLGILGYGVYFGAAHSVQQLAADAARASVAGLDASERVSLADEFVSKNAANYPLLDGERIKLHAAASPLSTNDFIVVVSFDASRLPIWVMRNFVPMPSENIERVAVIRRGGVQ